MPAVTRYARLLLTPGAPAAAPPAPRPRPRRRCRACDTRSRTRPGGVLGGVARRCPCRLAVACGQLVVRRVVAYEARGDRHQDALQDAMLVCQGFGCRVGFAISQELGACRDRRSSNANSERTGCDLDVGVNPQS